MHGLQALAAEPVLVVIQHVVDDVGDAGHFLMGGDVELRERALAELLGGSHHDGGAPAFAVRAQEGHGVVPDPPQLPPLVDDERPAHDRKHAKQRQNRLRDGSGLQDEVENVATEGLGGGQARLLPFQT
jgi:hypothetical protein